MKKIFTILTMIVAMFVMSSCKESLGVLYNVSLEGNASGDVVVTFPNGDLELNGDTALLFHYSNDTTAVKTVDSTPLLGAALESENEDVRTFATSVDNDFNVRFKDAQAGGSYHVRVTGYAKEPNTGIVILIDKEFDYPPVNAE